MIDHGDFRHYITIEKFYTSVDSEGALQESWEPFAINVPAQILPISSREFVTAQSINSKVATRIIIRYQPDISSEMRIVHRDNIYRIEGVIPDNQSGFEWITLTCSNEF